MTVQLATANLAQIVHLWRRGPGLVAVAVAVAVALVAGIVAVGAP